MIFYVSFLVVCLRDLQAFNLDMWMLVGSFCSICRQPTNQHEGENGFQTTPSPKIRSGGPAYQFGIHFYRFTFWPVSCSFVFLFASKQWNSVFIYWLEVVFPIGLWISECCLHTFGIPINIMGNKHLKTADYAINIICLPFQKYGYQFQKKWDA